MADDINNLYNTGEALDLDHGPVALEAPKGCLPECWSFLLDLCNSRVRVRNDNERGSKAADQDETQAGLDEPLLSEDSRSDSSKICTSFDVDYTSSFEESSTSTVEAAADQDQMQAGQEEELMFFMEVDAAADQDQIQAEQEEELMFLMEEARNINEKGSEAAAAAAVDQDQTQGIKKSGGENTTNQSPLAVDGSSIIKLKEYVYDYMKRKTMPEAAKAFAEEANIDPDYSVAIDRPESFMSEWWSFFSEAYKGLSMDELAVGGSSINTAMMGPPTMEMYDELMKHNPLVTNSSTLVTNSGSASISSQHPLADQQIKTGEEPNNAMMDSSASASEANESYEGFCTHDLEMIRLLTQIQDVRLQPVSSSLPTVSPALVDACISLLHQPSSASESAGLLKNEAPLDDRDMEMLRSLGLVSDDDE